MWTVGKNNDFGTARGNSKAIGWILCSPFFSWKTANPQFLYCGSLSHTSVDSRNFSSRREKSLMAGTNDAMKLPTSTTLILAAAGGSAPDKERPPRLGGTGKPL